MACMNFPLPKSNRITRAFSWVAASIVTEIGILVVAAIAIISGFALWALWNSLYNATTNSYGEMGKVITYVVIGVVSFTAVVSVITVTYAVVVIIQRRSRREAKDDDPGNSGVNNSTSKKVTSIPFDRNAR